jgi:hypothetical protein
VKSDRLNVAPVATLLTVFPFDIAKAARRDMICRPVSPSKPSGRLSPDRIHTMQSAIFLTGSMYGGFVISIATAVRPDRVTATVSILTRQRPGLHPNLSEPS